MSNKIKLYKVENQKGFSLLEVLVALSIMVGALVVLQQAWSGNLLRVRKAHLQNHFAVLLEKKMVEIESEYKEKKIEEIPQELSGDFSDFGEEFENYRWSFETQEFSFPDFTSSLPEDAKSNEMLVNMLQRMTEYINQSVLEATVRVTTLIGDQEITHSLTTYFVDFKRPLPAGP